MRLAEHDIAAMADAIVAHFRDPARCAETGEAGRHRTEAEFTADHTVQILRHAMNLAC